MGQMCLFTVKVTEYTSLRREKNVEILSRGDIIQTDMSATLVRGRHWQIHYLTSAALWVRAGKSYESW